MLKNRQSEKIKSPCWNKEHQAGSLRVEQANGEVFILPYIHLLYAHLRKEPDKEILTLTFSSHEICIEGKALADLAAAIQQFAADWIKPQPLRYADSRRTEVLINRIEVAERKQ